MALNMNSFADTILRQRVVAQIAAAREGVELDPGANSCEEMENVLFENASSREEYMQLIASLVLHLNSKKREAIKTGGQQHFQQVQQQQTQEQECNGETAEAAAPQETEDNTSQSATNT